jgi:malate dehydrogenase (oxaloacetate-decarboxylating)(NADP+)
MVALGDADALVSGVSMHYPETIRPALQVIGAQPDVGDRERAVHAGLRAHVVFCGDTTVNIDPTAEQLAQIAFSASGSRAPSASSRTSRCCRSRTSDR